MRVYYSVDIHWKINLRKTRNERNCRKAVCVYNVTRGLYLIFLSWPVLKFCFLVQLLLYAKVRKTTLLFSILISLGRIALDGFARRAFSNTRTIWHLKMKLIIFRNNQQDDFQKTNATFETRKKKVIRHIIIYTQFVNRLIENTLKTVRRIWILFFFFYYLRLYTRSNNN